MGVPSARARAARCGDDARPLPRGAAVWGGADVPVGRTDAVVIRESIVQYWPVSDRLAE